MLLDKGKAQTKYKKKADICWLTDQIEEENTLIQSVSVRSVTTRLIKVKRLAVVNRSIFRVLKSKNWPHEIPYNTKPVNAPFYPWYI